MLLEQIVLAINEMRTSGQEPAEVRVSRSVNRQIVQQMLQPGAWAATETVASVPVVIVDTDPAADFWAVLPVPLVGAD